MSKIQLPEYKTPSREVVEALLKDTQFMLEALNDLDLALTPWDELGGPPEGEETGDEDKLIESAMHSVRFAFYQMNNALKHPETVEL
jgi:hypothetical protein